MASQRDDCLFCNIVREGAHVKRGSGFVAIKDINPLAEVHLLVIPERHVDTFRDVASFPDDEAGRMLRFVAEVARKEGLDDYRVIVNVGAGAGATVGKLFGIRAIRRAKKIEVVVELQRWREGERYDRTGLDPIYTEIIGRRVPKVIIPVSPGKNITVISEVIAMNTLLKMTGVDTAQLFNEKLKDSMKSRNIKDDPAALSGEAHE